MEQSDNLKCAILIPTLNAGEGWEVLLNSVDEQLFHLAEKIIVDSGSTDHTVKLAKLHGFKVIEIDKSQFNHGKTRQLLIDLSGDADVCVFLTQDAVLADNKSVGNLVSVFNNSKIGMGYGRQLPHANARPLETHARLYNYSDVSNIIALSNQPALGFKAFFCSNSFAAYRKSALQKIGGFPSDSIMGEDAIVAAKMIKAGYAKAYVADATVFHSHSYTLREEYRRYFDTRVFHEQNIWMLNEYGKPTGEGLKFIKSEINYVLKKSPLSLFKSLASIGAKWLGYNSGRFYKRMPVKMLRMLSMHKFYWKEK